MILFGLGLAPLALTLWYFKTEHAPLNDLVAGQSTEATLDRLTDFSRYRLIAWALKEILLQIAAGPFVVLAVYVLLVGMPGREKAQGSITTPILVAALMFAGYMAVYVVSPHDLLWHLGTSLNRLLLHLWPLVLLSFFLRVATPEEALAR
jgi:hypothetical protein